MHEQQSQHRLHIEDKKPRSGCDPFHNTSRTNPDTCQQGCSDQRPNIGSDKKLHKELRHQHGKATWKNQFIPYIRL